MFNSGQFIFDEANAKTIIQHLFGFDAAQTEVTGIEPGIKFFPAAKNFYAHIVKQCNLKNFFRVYRTKGFLLEFMPLHGSFRHIQKARPFGQAEGCAFRKVEKNGEANTIPHHFNKMDKILIIHIGVRKFFVAYIKCFSHNLVDKVKYKEICRNFYDKCRELHF